MAITYFGRNDNGSTTYSSVRMYWFTAGYACPGEGLQDVKTLDINIAALDAGSLRLAIYDADGDMVCQWDASKTPVGTGWLEGTAFVDYAGDPVNPQLTGEEIYFLIVVGCADFAHSYYAQAVDSGVAKYSSSYNCTNLPSSKPSGSSGSREPCIRCGVEPAAGGPTLSAEQVGEEIHLSWTMPGD